MDSVDGIFRRALSKLLIEIFDGPPGTEAYVLNVGDQGLLRELDAIPPATASALTASGKASIAAHAQHVLYGLTLLARWFSGERDPFSGADYTESWRHTSVTEHQWRTLRQNLRRQFSEWREALAARTEWDEANAAGALASAIHAAYHLGAIRQIIVARNASGPGSQGRGRDDESH